MKRKMKKWFKRHSFVLPIIFLFIFFFYFVVMIRIDGFHFLGKKVQDISYQVQAFFMPKVKVNYQKVSDSLDKKIIKENKELHDLLKLEDSFSTYKFTYANVISRNQEQWFNKLVINKGKKDGIIPYLAVINEKGLMGRVVEVRENTSDILLLTAKDKLMKISVIIEKNGTTHNAFIDGYDQEENLLSVVLIKNTTEIEVGDSVITSGLGSEIPTGIPVGVVEKIEFDSLGVKQILKVKTNASFDNINYVGIISDGDNK